MKNVFDSALELEGISGTVGDLARSIYQQESGGGRNTKTSNAGAVGGMQIIPSTFRAVADKGWDISNPLDNARAGVRYVKQMFDSAGGDPKLAAVGYYGGPGAIAKARNGQAVSDPRNPNAPNTLQYGDQVVSRMGGGSAPDLSKFSDEEILKMAGAGKSAGNEPVLSKMSDEEVLKIAGISKPAKSPEVTPKTQTPVVEDPSLGTQLGRGIKKGVSGAYDNLTNPENWKEAALTLASPVEALMTGGSAMGAAIGSTARQAFDPDPSLSEDEKRQQYAANKERFTYTPRGATGRLLVEGINKVMTPWNAVAREGGDLYGELTNNKLAGDQMSDAVSMMLPVKGMSAAARGVGGSLDMAAKGAVKAGDLSGAAVNAVGKIPVVGNVVKKTMNITATGLLGKTAYKQLKEGPSPSTMLDKVTPDVVKQLAGADKYSTGRAAAGSMGADEYEDYKAAGGKLSRKEFENAMKESK